MEGFDLIATGAWSLVPPILALILALVTKEVYSSLAVGVFTGMLIYQFSLNGAGLRQFLDAVTMIFRMMSEQIASNGGLILVLSLLGALTCVIAAAGGAAAYGIWVSKHVKNARAAQLLTAFLGLLIFVDDGFNSLTVGTVMYPVTDRYHISREKLAWIIDSTAAPVCILAPVSSWAAAMSGFLGENGFSKFIRAIPYNFYALATLVFVFVLCAADRDFGPMKRAQAIAAQKPHPVGDSAAQQGTERDTTVATAGTARVSDLVVPILVLIVCAILSMLYVGGFFDGVDFGAAVGENPILGLNIGVGVALALTVVLYLPRRLLSPSVYVEKFIEGTCSMVGTMMILVLAWSLGACCRYLLGTGEFVSGVLTDSGVSLSLLPAFIFVVAAFLSFSMGTSWGVIALILPIVVSIFSESDPLFLLAVGASFGGSVFGDHASPLSDTTVLSSAGAQCNHLNHVSTQLPYALVVACSCGLAYVVSGFIVNPWLGLIIAVICSCAVGLLLSKRE